MSYRGFAEDWRNSLAENSAMHHAMADQQHTICLLQTEVDRLRDEVAKKDETIRRLQAEVDDLNKELVSLRDEWDVNAITHRPLQEGP